MPSRRGFVRRPAVRKIPNYTWSVVATVVQVTIPAASKVLVGSFISGGSDFVIERTRGLIHVASDQVTASEFQVGAYGHTIISEDAFAAGIGSIPSPVADTTNDWFVYQPLQNDRVVITANGANDPNGTMFEIDSKAKRIFQTGTRVALVVENIHATFGMRVILHVRMLSKLRA